MKKPKRLADQTQAQQEAYVHRQAQDTSNIVFTNHVLKRMEERKITTSYIVEALRKGRMKRPAELDIKTGLPVCRLERLVAGREITVAVAIDDENPELIVVTAMN